MTTDLPAKESQAQYRRRLQGYGYSEEAIQDKIDGNSPSEPPRKTEKDDVHKTGQHPYHGINYDYDIRLSQPPGSEKFSEGEGGWFFRWCKKPDLPEGIVEVDRDRIAKKEDILSIKNIKGEEYFLNKGEHLFPFDKEEIQPPFLREEPDLTEIFKYWRKQNLVNNPRDPGDPTADFWRFWSIHPLEDHPYSKARKVHEGGKEVSFDKHRPCKNCPLPDVKEPPPCKSTKDELIKNCQKYKNCYRQEKKKVGGGCLQHTYFFDCYKKNYSKKAQRKDGSIKRYSEPEILCRLKILTPPEPPREKGSFVSYGVMENKWEVMDQQDLEETNNFHFGEDDNDGSEEENKIIPAEDREEDDETEVYAPKEADPGDCQRYQSLVADDRRESKLRRTRQRQRQRSKSCRNWVQRFNHPVDLSNVVGFNHQRNYLSKICWIYFKEFLNPKNPKPIKPILKINLRILAYQKGLTNQEFALLDSVLDGEIPLTYRGRIEDGAFKAVLNTPLNGVIPGVLYSFPLPFQDRDNPGAALSIMKKTWENVLKKLFPETPPVGVRSWDHLPSLERVGRIFKKSALITRAIDQEKDPKKKFIIEAYFLRGLSQADIAKEVGLNQSSISRILKGFRNA